MSNEDKMREKVAQLVATQGKPKKKSSDAEKVITGDNSSIHIHGNLIIGDHNVTGAASPKAKPVEKMDEEEKEAFKRGEWDGLDRRERDKKQYKRAVQTRARRKRDRQAKFLHYTILILLFLSVMSSLAGAIIMGELNL